MQTWPFNLDRTVQCTKLSCLIYCEPVDIFPLMSVILNRICESWRTDLQPSSQHPLWMCVETQRDRRGLLLLTLVLISVVCVVKAVFVSAPLIPCWAIVRSLRVWEQKCWGNSSWVKLTVIIKKVFQRCFLFFLHNQNLFFLTYKQ